MIHLCAVLVVVGTCSSNVCGCCAPCATAYWTSKVTTLLQSRMGYAASSAVGRLNCFPTTVGFHVACLWLLSQKAVRGEKRHLERPTILSFCSVYPHACNGENRRWSQHGLARFRLFQGNPRTKNFQGSPTSTECCLQCKTSWWLQLLNIPCWQLPFVFCPNQLSYLSP